jgi:hypothetical protein
MRTSSRARSLRPLVGHAVRWQQATGQEQPRPRFADEQESTQADRGLLQGLRYDLDALGLLPPAGTDLEQGWKAPASALGDLLAMGGDLRSSFSDEHLAETGGQGLMFEPAAFWRLDLALEGEIQLKLQDTREQDGEQLAIFAVKADVQAEGSSLERHCDLNTHYCDCEDLDCGCHPDPAQADRELQLDLEGTLVWNLSGNHLQGYFLEGEYAVHYVFAKAMFGGDDPEDLSIFDARCTGEATWQLAVAPTAAR